jgi:hypothetical protein
MIRLLLCTAMILALTASANAQRESGKRVARAWIAFGENG